MGGCKKITYLSYKVAEKKAEKLYQKKKWNLRAYKCHRCKKYHLYTSFKDRKYYEKKEVSIENDSMARYEIEINEIGKSIEEKEELRNFLLNNFGLK